MTNKIALITGISGQDGSYLTELLLKKKYIVHGIIRRSSSFNTGRIDHLYNDKKILNKKLFLHYGDLTDPTSIFEIIKKVKPNEIYNLAAQSHVKVSFNIPYYTTTTNSLGFLNILDAVRSLRLSRFCKIYQASTSELYGNTNKKKLNEKSSFSPNSPYAISKLYSYYLGEAYKNAYNMFICNGILFNHESPRRGETFVTQKIVYGIIDFLFNSSKTLELGNLYSSRDWGHAKDYVNAMWLILQKKNPKNYVISTGNSINIKQFVHVVLKNLGVKIKWYNSGVNEYAKVLSYDSKVLSNYLKKINLENKIIFKKKYNKKIISVNKKYFRENEVNYLNGDSSKAFKDLKWKPKYNINSLINEMINDKLNKIL